MTDGGAGTPGPQVHGAHRPRPFVVCLVASAVCLLLSPSIAFADILTFTTGRTMSVTAARVDGDRLVLSLRDGGEASVPRALVARLDPDEVVDAEAPPAELAPAGPAPSRGVAALPALDGRPFADVIAAAAAAHGVDVRLVHAVIEAESNYQPRARSPKGARGLMQLMPGTARQYAVRDPYDPGANIDAGVRHLKALLTRFELSQALAAYNAGEAAVRQHGGIPPFAETRAYVARILGRIGR